MPRLGAGMPITSSLSQEAVTGIDDFLFESFSAGEMHPIQTASRTNLLTYSEDFSQWTRTGNTAISATNVTNPTGTTNATRITGLDGDGSNDLRFFPNSFNSANRTLTFSVHLKGSGTLRLQMSNGIDQGIQEVVTLTSDWKRHTFTGVFNSTTTSTTFHVNIDDSTATATTYDIWGVQLEEDGFVSNYIPTSGSTVTVSTTLNDTSEVWDFDGTDIMLEADPEDEGFFEEGSNVVTNGDFAVDSNWSKGAGWTISDGKASNDGSTGNLTQSGILIVGEQYEITVTVSDYVSGSVQVTAGAQFHGSSSVLSANGTYTLIQTCSPTTSLFLVSSSFNGKVDNVTVREYAVQPKDI